MADQPTEARLALYRKLSTEHLQTLLRSDLDGPPLDEATVDSILTVLAERRRTPADTSAAWQDFSAYYSTPDSPGAPVRRTRAHLQKTYARLRIPLRVVSAAAAMFILIFVPPRRDRRKRRSERLYHLDGRVSQDRRSAACRLAPAAGRRISHGQRGPAAAARRAGSLRRVRRRSVLGPGGRRCVGI